MAYPTAGPGPFFRIILDGSGLVQAEAFPVLMAFLLRRFNWITTPGEETTFSIWCIWEDADSRLWIGTENQGLLLYERDLDRFKRYIHNDSCNNCISSNQVYSITSDSSGIMWIGTADGLNQFDPVTNSFQLIRSRVTFHHPFPAILFSTYSSTETTGFGLEPTGGWIILTWSRIELQILNVNSLVGIVIPGTQQPD